MKYVKFIVLILFLATATSCSSSNQASNENKQSAEQYRNICLNQFATTNYSEAIKNCNLAVQNDPNDSKSYNTLGNIYKAQKLHDQAIQNFLKVEELYKAGGSDKFDMFTAYISMGDVYVSKGDNYQAIQYFEKAKQIDPPKGRICDKRINRLNR